VTPKAVVFICLVSFSSLVQVDPEGAAEVAAGTTGSQMIGGMETEESSALEASLAPVPAGARQVLAVVLAAQIHGRGRAPALARVVAIASKRIPSPDHLGVR
jgi:hypothetical protein